MPKENGQCNTPLYRQAYEIIRKDITANRLKPGDILTEKNLSEKLGISRTPIRAALQRLVSDGLATSDSNKSVIVSNVTWEDIQEVTQVRAAMETLTIRLLPGKITPDDISQLWDISRLEKELDRAANSLGLVDSGYQFHMALAKITKNQFLVDMIDRIQTTYNRFLILSGTMDRYGRTGLEEHEEIIAYLERAQFEHAELAMRDHVLNIGNRILIP